MKEDSILKIADGHPVLRTGGYLPLLQAAAVLGLDAEDLLREAADGRIAAYCRLVDEPGYLTRAGDFEIDDPEQGTWLVPGVENRPARSRLHRAFGVFRVAKGDAQPMASSLLAGKEFDLVVVETVQSFDGLTTFVPNRTLKLSIGEVELAATELDAFRGKLAQSIAPAALELARIAVRTVQLKPEAAKSDTPLLEALDAYSRHYLPQMVTSQKEIDRIRTGIKLLAEFKGNMPIRDVNADVLREFRDQHLAEMPANENLVRIKYGTVTMTQSIAIVKGTTWPLMSANERDLRMQWICRMFKWLHKQKWLADDASTGLRGESVLTKAERTRASTALKERAEFTPAEIVKIFSAPVFQVDASVTQAGTFRTFQPFHYWLPLLGLFTGARIGELSQLYLEDFQLDHQVWYIDINQNTDDKSLKNAWSARRVPIHPKLISLGLPEWIERLRIEGYVRLFPELSWNITNRYAKEPIRFMSQFLERMDLPRDGTKVFHSFRHGMNNELQKRSAMPDIMRKRLLGHEPGESVNERHYLSDPAPRDVLAYLVGLNMHLPEIRSYDLKAGTLAVLDALRRKDSGRGAKEVTGKRMTGLDGVKKQHVD
jgi:integrase